MAEGKSTGGMRYALRRDLCQQGGDEFSGGKHFEISLGACLRAPHRQAPVAFGAVEDAAGGGIVGDLFERERRPQEVLP